MADPFTLAGLGAVALSEGIRFLYDQVSELLRRRRERQAAEPEPPADTVPATGSGILAGELRPEPIDHALLESRLSEVEALYDQLTRYANGLADVDPADPGLVERVAALRGLLELVYRQRITFRGEPRPASGTSVQASAEAERVDGYLAAVRARSIGEADLTVRTRVTDIGPTGEVVGVDADRIGE